MGYGPEMREEFLIVASHLGGAMVAGSLIGLERTYHARPAGFRTHTLVCVASSLLMLVTLYQWQWLKDASQVSLETVRTDPTRMAQGIMTGIGFLGAGVIFKESLSVRGLTTAASIWMTAAIGILFGIGFWIPAVLATAITIGVLSVFRSVESWLPQHTYVHHRVAFSREDAMSEAELRALIGGYDFSIANMSYAVLGDGREFEYRMILRTSDPNNVHRFAEALRDMPRVRSFKIAPTGD